MRRLALDVLTSTAVAFCFLAAWQVITEAPLRNPLFGLTLAAGIALTGAGFHALFRVVVRAGTIRALFQRLREGHDGGIAILGAESFIGAFPSTYMLSVIEAVAALTAVMALELSGFIAQAHGTLGAVVGAGFTSLVVCLSGLVVMIAGFVYVLAVVDGCSFREALSRFSALTQGEVGGRFLGIAIWLFPLSLLLSFVDFVSTMVSSSMPTDSVPVTFVLIPVVLAAYSVVVDTVAVIFVAAASERLPLGFATRISLVDPQ